MRTDGLGSRIRRFGGLVIGVALALVLMNAPRRAADGQVLLPIVGNHPASVPADWRPLPAGQVLHLRAVLALRNTDQLSKLEADLQDRDSPLYHRWLTTDQFISRFGPTTQQMQAVAGWLTRQGLRVTASDIRQRSVEFSGHPATVAPAFQTALVGDGRSYANLGDPLVPADLAPIIQAVLGLSKFSQSAPAGAGGSVSFPDVTIPPVGTAFGPSDLYTFYDEKPLISGGNRGTGNPDCIAMAENNDVDDGTVAAFNDQFGLPPVTLTRVLVDGTDPGLDEDHSEAFLDVEWGHAVAPNTPIYFYIGDFFDDVARAVADNLCGVITASISEQCPDVPSIIGYNSTLVQAVMQGQTVFHAAADYGANFPCGKAVPIPPFYKDQTVSNCGSPPMPEGDKGATFAQPSVDEQAASPYLTSVGGTMFDPVYDSAGNDISVIGDNLETAWNEGGTLPDHCPIKDATGGGQSTLFPKPAWQKGFGVPDDGVRDVPDIALGANGDGAPGFFIATCHELPCNLPATIEQCNDKNKDTICFTTSGGTSIASPMWAALSRLIAQSQGVTRLGNINPRLYELGNLLNPVLGLHDITIGNNVDNPCTDGNCITGYDAGPGFDLVSGWGTPDFAALVASFPGASATVSPTTTTIAAGTTANAGQFTVTNTTGAPLMVDSVSVTLSSANIFSKLALTATVGGVSSSPVEAVSAANTVFMFTSPVAIPIGGTATLTLQATAAATIPSGAALTQSRSDGGGGWTRSMLPLPAALIAVFMLVAVALTGRRTALASVAIFLVVAAALWGAGCGSGNGNGNAFHPALSSTQNLAQGSIVLSDGQGGIILVSGLPAPLGTVTVRF